MTPAKDDRKGVFVPLWAMEDCAGDARDAMVLAQITWWLQPAQRDGRRRTSCIVERDGDVWLTLTDAELGEDIGMTRDQVGRARRKLAASGLIVSKSGSVDGRKVTLTTAPRAADESADPHNGECEVAQTKVQGRTDVGADPHNAPPIQTDETNTGDASSVDDADSSIVELCELLADRVHTLRGGVDRPAITGRWCRDMRLLVERGPLGVDKPEAMTVENVRRAIEYTFDELAEPGADGFCWARQVQSPHALRKHLPKLREAARRASVGRVGRGAQAVDRVAHRIARDGAESTKREPLGLLAEHEPKEITG